MPEKTICSQLNLYQLVFAVNFDYPTVRTVLFLVRPFENAAKSCPVALPAAWIPGQETRLQHRCTDGKIMLRQDLWQSGRYRYSFLPREKPQNVHLRFPAR